MSKFQKILYGIMGIVAVAMISLTVYAYAVQGYDAGHRMVHLTGAALILTLGVDLIVMMVEFRQKEAQNATPLLFEWDEDTNTVSL